MATEGVREQTVQNQAVDPQKVDPQKSKDVPIEGSIQRFALVIIGLLLTVAATVWGLYAVHPADPYVESVLAMTGDASRGREIFKLNCATCHGLDAGGEVGPDLRAVSERKSRAALITQVISGQTPPMPQFQPEEKDMADLLSFLETL